MDFLGLINELIGKDGSPGTLELWCGGFAPELTLSATIVVMLLARLPSWGHKVNAFYPALVGSLIGLYYAAPWTKLLPGAQPTDTMLGQEIFDGLLIYDPLTVYFRSVLMVLPFMSAMMPP